MQPETKRIADEIERYIQDNPNSADTLDGIKRWWLVGFDFNRADLAIALDYLVAAKKLAHQRRANGDFYYAIPPALD
jgi:hypothetical protein